MSPPTSALRLYRPYWRLLVSCRSAMTKVTLTAVSLSSGRVRPIMYTIAGLATSTIRPIEPRAHSWPIHTPKRYFQHVDSSSRRSRYLEWLKPRRQTPWTPRLRCFPQQAITVKWSQALQPHLSNDHVVNKNPARSGRRIMNPTRTGMA